LNDANEIAYIHVIDDQTIDKSVKGVKYGSKVISKIDADKKKLTNLDSSKFNELDGLDEGKDFIVFLDGKPAKFSDLKELDVYSIYYADGDEDKYLIFATRNVLEGKVEKVVSRNSKDIRLTVGGKTLKVYTNASYSEDANKDVKKIDSSNLDLINNLDGEEVKLYLDASGRVRHIETKDAIDDRKPKAIVTRQATENTSKDTFDFVVMTQKGKKENISLDKKDIYDTKGVNYDKNGKANDLIDILKPRKDGSTVLLELNYDSKGEVDKVRILDTKLIASSGSAWNNLADEDDNIVGDYEVTDKTAIFKMTGELTNDKRVELKSPGTAKFKSIADSNEMKVYYTVNEDKGEVEAIFVIEGTGLGSDVRFGMVKDYGTVNKQDSIKLVTKDGDSVVEKEFKLDGDKEDLRDYKGIKRGDFIAFTTNSSDEIEVDDVWEVINGSSIEDDSYPEILNQKDWAKAGIDNMQVAHVEKVDGNTITYNKKSYYTKASTAFFDAYDDLEGADGVEEGDYIVMIDAEDIGGTRFDYVVIVSSEDEIEKYNISEKSVEAFLKQKPIDDEFEKPELSNIKGEAVESELLPGVFNYTVTGKIANDKSVKSFTLKVGTKTTKVTIKDGAFSASQIGKADQDAELTIVYTDKDGKEQTIIEEVTF